MCLVCVLYIKVIIHIQTLFINIVNIRKKNVFNSVLFGGYHLCQISLFITSVLVWQCILNCTYVHSKSSVLAMFNYLKTKFKAHHIRNRFYLYSENSFCWFIFIAVETHVGFTCQMRQFYIVYYTLINKLLNLLCTLQYCNIVYTTPESIIYHCVRLRNECF